MAEYFWTAFEWGAYLKKTSRLTLAEHGAYLLLMAEYYQTGKPLPANAEVLLRVCRAFADHEKAAVTAVLAEFFTLDGDVYRNQRADEEIAKSASIVQARQQAGVASASMLTPEQRSARAKAAAEARWKTKDLRDLDANKLLTECSQDARQLQSQLHINTNPPNPPRGERKKRRSRTEILSPYPPEVSALVNEILPDWPKVQPKDRSPIHFDVPMTAERIDGLLREPGVTPEILKQAASKYLGEQKNYYRAPQFFFGPGAGEKSPPWVAYARMTVHQEAQRGLQ
jgi:uncharacterized protein YdaU (DUF1376 family)